MRLHRVGLGLLFAALAGACGSGGGGGGGDPPPECVADFEEGFESGLGAWQADADVPLDPNRPGEFVAWSIATSGEQAAEGTTSARYDLDGRQDDGTIWLVQAFDAVPSTTVRVTVRFIFWSETESFNDIAHVVAYAGSVPPALEADFARRRANEAAGWVPYEFEFLVDTDASGQVHVAFGISAVWETEMTYFVDAVEICLD